MATYDFRHIPRKQDLAIGGPVVQPQPETLLRPATEGPTNEPRTRMLTNDLNIDNTEQHVKRIIPAFFHLDRGMLDYFGDIKVPSGEELRNEPLRVRIAGGDKSILIWEEELEDGSKRIRLPVMSINRAGHEPNPKKAFPAWHPMRKEYVNEGSRIRLMYAPKAFIVNYDLSIWTNRKEEMETIIYQIITRFDHGNQAGFWTDMGTMNGHIRLNLVNVTDASDIESDAETLAKVRYEITLTAETWVPIEEVIVPTVIGRVYSVHEQNGRFLEILRSNSEFLRTSPFDLPGNDT